MSEVTAISEIESRPVEASTKLLEIAYDELRRMAANKLSREAPGQTLQATALVHEVWLQLVKAEKRHFENRTHFFAVAAEAMRHILVDRARRRRALRHGGDLQRVDFEENMLAGSEEDEQLLTLNDALEKFELKHPIQAKVVKLRYFAGMSNEEIAEVVGVSLSTVKNYWVFSKAWLFKEMKGL